MSEVRLSVNGARVGAQVEDRTLLVYFLRDHLGLTGTHVGCDTSQCGACTVLVDGRAVKSCTVLAVQIAGRRVTTIEGLAQDGDLHELQQAFHEEHGLQCGFCTPGLIMTLVDYLGGHDRPDAVQLREAISGNVCRCTGYQNIVRAALAAADIARSSGT